MFNSLTPDKKLSMLNKVLLVAVILSILPNISSFVCDSYIKLIMIVFFSTIFPILSFVFSNDIIDIMQHMEKHRWRNILLLLSMCWLFLWVVSKSIQGVFIPYCV